MTFPKHMDDEQLAVYGFVIDPDDPNQAYNKRYPKLSVRYRCQSCKMWSDSKGGKVMECSLCHRGAKPARQNAQFRKLYACCNDEACEVWRSIQQDFRHRRYPVENCHEGVGAYLDLAFTQQMAEEARQEFRDWLNDRCFSWRGAIKLCCPANGKMPNLRRK